MPGDEVGDRVHNFFAQDNLSQSHNHSQVAQGNWPLPNNNPWAGNQRQINFESSKLNNYETQRPGTNCLIRLAGFNRLLQHGHNL